MKLSTRTAVAAAALLASTAMLATGAGAASAGTDLLGTPAATPFYQPPSPLPAGAPGTPIKASPITYAGKATNVTSTRIMYLSRDVSGRPMPVTGTVTVPNTPWSGAGRRPVVAYAPATVGLGPQCVLSLAAGGTGTASSTPQLTLMDGLLAKGFAVAQTDYQGAGTPGPSTYMVRAPQGHAVLDVARAAEMLPGTGLSSASPVGIFGYSQGGGAAAAADELAATYAPELNLKGVVAGAPPANLYKMAQASGPGAAALQGYAAIGVSQAYPDAAALDMLNAQGRAAFTDLQGSCVTDASTKYLWTGTGSWTTTGQSIGDVIAGDPTLTAVVKDQSEGGRAPSAPTLVESAYNDDLVPYSIVSGLVKDWCGRGGTVEQRTIWAWAAPTHVMAAFTVGPDGADWLAARFAGTPAKSTC
ncbi:lipase family protein [Nocardioides ultimimeridianus]